MSLFRRTAHKFRNFLRQIVRSCYDMEWYRVVRTRPWTRAFRYLVALCGLLALGLGAVTLPSMLGVARETTSFIESKFPPEASFAFKNHRFSTTLPMPYEIDQDGFVILVDTSIEDAVFPADKVKNQGIIIGRDALFFKESENQWRSYSFNEVPDGETTGAEIIGLARSYALPAMLLLTIFLALSMFLALSIGSVVYALIGSVAAFAIGIIARTRLTYRQWFAVSLTAVTLPTLTDIVLQTFNINIPFAFTFVFFAFVIAVAADERTRPTTALTPAASQ